MASTMVAKLGMEGEQEWRKEGRSECPLDHGQRNAAFVNEIGSKAGKRERGTYLSSVRIRSAACLVTSLPFLPIAMPTSAALSEGASLTPSPEK